MRGVDTGVAVPRRGRRGLRAIGLTAAVSLCLIGTLAAPTRSPASPAGPLTRVSILNGGNVIGWAPAYLALGMGFFRDEGLEVEYILSVQGAPAAVTAVVSGSAFMSFTGAPVVINAVRQGSPVRIVFVDYAEYSAEVIVSNKFLAGRGVTPQAPLEQKVRALKGAKIAIDQPGDSNSQLAVFLLKEFGINPDTDVELVSLSNIPAKMAALARGSVDAMVASPPSGEQIEKQGLGKVFIRPQEDSHLHNYPYLVGTANLRDIQARPQLIESVIRAMARAMQMLRRDPAAAKPIVRKYFANFSQPVFDLAYDNMLGGVPASPILSRDEFGRLRAFAELQGKPLQVTYDQAVNRQLAAEVMAKMGK